METLAPHYQPNNQAVGNLALCAYDRVGGESEGAEDLVTSCGD